MSTLSYIGFTMRTRNVNHTGLYTYVQSHPVYKNAFKEREFELMYKTTSSRYKNVTSREHDEVISRAIKAMGLQLQFVIYQGNRYVNIFGKVRNEEELAQITEKLNICITRFQRKPEPIEMKQFTNPTDANSIL